MAITKKTTTKKVKAENAEAGEVKAMTSTHPQNTFAIKNPWISEKSYHLAAAGKYVFLVDKNTNKIEVKKAINAIYKVDPVSVNMITTKEKPTRFGRSATNGKLYKKAIVTLKKGQTLDIMPS